MVLCVHGLVRHFSFFAGGGYRRIQSEPRFLLATALLYLACMQCFLMFEANSRYGFTTFPILTLFGAVGVYLFVGFLSHGLVRRALILTTAAAVATALVVNSERLVNTVKPDGAFELASGQSAICTFQLTEKMRLPISNEEVAVFSSLMEIRGWTKLRLR